MLLYSLYGVEILDQEYFNYNISSQTRLAFGVKHAKCGSTQMETFVFYHSNNTKYVNPSNKIGYEATY